MDLGDIYTEVLLENTRNKQNKKKLIDDEQNKVIKKIGYNASCGDDLEIFVKIKNNKIIDISFDGKGCAISEAAANIMAEMVKGKTIDETYEIIQLYHDMLFLKETNEEKLMELGDAYAFKNIAYMPARIKCATIAFNTLKKLLDEYKGN